MPAITLSASYDMDSNIVISMSYNDVEATFVKIYFENMDLNYLQRLSLEIFEANRHVVVTHINSLKETSSKDIYHFDNGQLIREEKYFQGRLHCESGPALYERGNVKHSPLYSIKRWRLNGEPYQPDDQPSEIWTTHNGKVKHRWENSRHDPNLPDSILYRSDGTIFSEEWLDHRGRQHREGDMPAAITYHHNRNNSVAKETWKIHGDISRANGPACITYAEDGIMMQENF